MAIFQHGHGGEERVICTTYWARKGRSGSATAFQTSSNIHTRIELRFRARSFGSIPFYPIFPWTATSKFLRGSIGYIEHHRPVQNQIDVSELGQARIQLTSTATETSDIHQPTHTSIHHSATAREYAMPRACPSSTQPIFPNITPFQSLWECSSSGFQIAH